MNNKIVLVIIVALIVLGGGYVAIKGMKSAPQQKTTVSAEPSPSASPSGVVVASQEVTVSGNEFAFTPSTITVKKGQPVKITFKNTGKYPHNFTVSELNVKSDTVQSGEETTVTFTPDKAGNFTYICAVPGHADRGMKGTLTVE